jgi:hypothetical protein
LDGYSSASCPQIACAATIRTSAAVRVVVPFQDNRPVHPRVNHIRGLCGGAPMRAERLFPVVIAVGFLLLGCASNSRVTSDPGSPTAVVTPTSSDQSDSEGPQPSDRAGTPAQESARPSGPPPPLNVLVETLRKAGVRSVAQCEPTHGARFRILCGRMAGATVFATAGRDHSALVGGRTEVRRSEQHGVLVRVLADEDGQYVCVRDRGVTWLLSHHSHTTPQRRIRALMDLARRIAHAS